ncbi:MAG TPA: GAF domain-containing protein [Candidatus Kapabacteria bacterium]|jgi:GAF domain-containing protein
MTGSSLNALISIEEPLITALSNTAAFLFHSMERINWCGFYLFDGEKLVLGPFGGKPACTVIEMGKGVCGRAALERKIIRVSDVNDFVDHIACDPASQSEIVLPIILKDGTLFGVLDVDAPVKDRFSEQDEMALDAAVQILVGKIGAILKKNPNRLL